MRRKIMIGAPSPGAPYLAMPKIVRQDYNGIEGQEIQSVLFPAQQAFGGVR